MPLKRYSQDYRGDFYLDPNGGEWVKWDDVKYYLDEEYIAGYDRGWSERGEVEGIKNGN